MKKSIVLAILGIAAGVIGAQAQGTVNFSNYYSNTAPTVNFGTTFVPLALQGLAVGSEFQAELCYVVGTGASEATVFANPIAASLTHFGTTYPNSPAADGDSVNGAGWWIGGGNEVLNTPATAAGTVITAEVLAFNGTTYGNSTYVGKSGLFTLTLGGGIAFAASLNGNMPNFTVNGVPEPTTMALGGLGLAALLVARRKKA
jgi:hypothetical protein